MRCITKGINLITHSIMILVDKIKPIEELVKQGNFNWSTEGINSSNYPGPFIDQVKKGKRAIFHFNKFMSSKDVEAEMNKVGYTSGTIWDLLLLAIKEPTLQKHFSIVALGSLCKIEGCLRVPCLCGWLESRELVLCYFDYNWDKEYRFLGVLKEKRKSIN